MALSLKEARAVSDLANLLYGFLPGSGHPKWKGHVSFRSVAEDAGVGEFWQAGSKTPMIVGLLTRTLEHRRVHFEKLVLGVVKAGLTYREKQGFPVTAEEIDTLNGLILEVGFKFPDLWDPDFARVVSVSGATRARARVRETRQRESDEVTASDAARKTLGELRDEFYGLCTEENRPKAGLQLERVLNRLFELAGLSPREPFKVVGEQIDGSFVLDHEVYLLEAKWHKEACGESDLLIFRGKIEGKSKYTRGLFVSVNGVTPGGEEGIERGKQPCFFIADGYDLTMVLEGRMGLIEFLRRRQRLLAEEGRVRVSFGELE